MPFPPFTWERKTSGPGRSGRQRQPSTPPKALLANVSARGGGAGGGGRLHLPLPPPPPPVPTTEAGRASVRLQAWPSAEPEKTLAASYYTRTRGWRGPVLGSGTAPHRPNVRTGPQGSKGVSDRLACPGFRSRQGRDRGHWLPARVTCLPSAAAEAGRGGHPGWKRGRPCPRNSRLFPKTGIMGGIELGAPDLPRTSDVSFCSLDS